MAPFGVASPSVCMVFGFQRPGIRVLEPRLAPDGRTIMARFESGADRWGNVTDQVNAQVSPTEANPSRSVTSPNLNFKTAYVDAAIEPKDADPSGPITSPSLTFETVYDDNVDWMWRCARRLGVSDAAADDVIQSAFLVVHRRLREFEGHSSVKTWIFAILLRIVQGHRRTTRRKSPHLFNEPADPDDLSDTHSRADPERALERAEASRIIDGLLDCLDHDERVVFVMAELEQMTAPEISEATGLTPKAVYSRLRAARVDFERAASRLRRREAKGARHE